MKLRTDNKGFTLIELLIVVAIIGIIAAIAIPNLLAAIQRGKQKRTMSDMRSIGTSVESYQVDLGNPPTVVGNGTTDSVQTKLTDYLTPTFIKKFPGLDAGGTAMIWSSQALDDYSVSSFGRNRVIGTVKLGATADFNDDIYFSNGQFTMYPEGVQK